MPGSASDIKRIEVTLGVTRMLLLELQDNLEHARRLQLERDLSLQEISDSVIRSRQLLEKSQKMLRT